jgi:rSAM/selenodomain-associated transferase 1
MKNKNALIIIAKYPEPGKVKTRIHGLSDKQRTELYTKLLEFTMKKLSSIPGVDTFIAFAPDSAEKYFKRFGVKLIPLSKGDLGTRMFKAFERVFRSGYQKAALVGADIPDLSSAIILRAMNLLSTHDLVFGPAKDGGYYLVGMSKLIKEVFEDVPWSSDQTLEKSLDQSKTFNYSVCFIDTLSDIDTIDDVKRAGLLQSIIT